MKPYATGDVYLNFTGDEGEDRVQAGFGEDYDRLAARQGRVGPGQRLPAEPQRQAALGGHVAVRAGPWDRERPCVEIGGLRVAYQRAGRGPPLVLLHGILSDSRAWTRQLAGLAGQFTVVAWDAPGAGQSADPPESFSASDYADCLSEFIVALDLDPAHVLGLSWGGVLAQELYRFHPERVRSLILADTYAGWKGSLPKAVCEERLASCLRESRLPPEEWVPGWLPGLLMENAPPELRDEVVEVMSDFHPAGYRAMAARRCRLGHPRPPTADPGSDASPLGRGRQARSR